MQAYCSTAAHMPAATSAAAMISPAGDHRSSGVAPSWAVSSMGVPARAAAGDQHPGGLTGQVSGSMTWAR